MYTFKATGETTLILLEINQYIWVVSLGLFLAKVISHLAFSKDHIVLQTSIA